MKKLFIAAVAVLAFSSANAQETKFGVKAGYIAQTFKIKIDTGFGTTNVTGSEGGFFVGGFADIGVSEKITFHPELLYAAVSNNATVMAPLLVKFPIAESFNVMVGPGLAYALDLDADQFSVSGDIGASYDINENIVVDARYDIGLVGEVKLGGFSIGVGYKF